MEYLKRIENASRNWSDFLYIGHKLYAPTTGGSALLVRATLPTFVMSTLVGLPTTTTLVTLMVLRRIRIAWLVIVTYIK